VSVESVERLGKHLGRNYSNLVGTSFFEFLGCIRSARVASLRRKTGGNIDEIFMTFKPRFLNLDISEGGVQLESQ
jgi:hypothetical protein